MGRSNIKNSDTRSRIKTAALAEFAEKGKFGSRMEEIGRRAQVNKAMVYYYYSSKECLFREVLEDSLSFIFNSAGRKIERVIKRDDDDCAAVREIVSAYFDAFSANQEYVKIIQEALANEPDEVRERVLSQHRTTPFHTPMPLVDFFERGMKKGVFRQVDSRQFILSIISVSLFYFFSKPIAKVMLDLEIKDEKAFLETRKNSVIELLMRGIGCE